MIRTMIGAALLASVANVALADPVPKDKLLVPPATATRYVIVSETNTHGDEWRWTTDDGAIAFRKSQSLRGWITETDARARVDKKGNLTSLEIRGVTPSGDAAETFVMEDGTGRWDSGADRGEAATGDAFYLSRGGPGSLIGLFAERLARGGAAKLLPSGTASVREGQILHIEDDAGDVHAHLLFIDGLTATPEPVWVDDEGNFFASVGYMGLMREGYEEHFLTLRDVQDKAVIAATSAIAALFLTEEARAPLLIDNVRLFDADAGRFVDNQAVMSAGGRIVAIAPAGMLRAPEGARTIDGAGKTLVPGLWDAHKHFANGYDLLANVATGMTSIRSPGNQLKLLVESKERRAKNDLLAPEIFGTIIIDQVHPLSAQGAELVASEAEAVAAVHKAADAGLWGVKFYTSMKPEWIAPAAAEAHRRGLQVLGHVPATMRPLDAVRAGYDEVTHLNFIMMQVMPQEVVDVSNTAARFEGPAKYARHADLDGKQMRAFIAELAERGTWVDPTIMIFEGSFLGDKPELAPAYKPYAGTLPAIVERGLNEGGYPLFDDLERSDFRRSYAKMLELIGKLHEAGIPIVGGTDGWGMELVREIEIYEQAGMSKAAALQTITINPARRVGIADRTGSIRVGKEADMVLVDGDVSQDLGALRRVLTVISDGYVMDGDDLRKAAGFSGMPR